jgi:predicted nucleotidyltransferase component of viral defense system
MIGEMLSERIRDYAPANTIEQENVLQELMQHFVLASLSRAGFFSFGGFHGGTCLRILFGTRRFSEDLDFLLKNPDPDFRWKPYLDRIRSDLQAEDIHFDVQDKTTAARAVQKAFLKTNSIGQILSLDLPFSRHQTRKIRIKLEVDTRPPLGSLFETRYITFPVTAAITVQTLESGFATKSHALLCREYTKGRDWYDLLWYISKKIIPDLELLGNALAQQGPWAGKKMHVTADWYVEALRERIREIDWEAARSDVARFIPSSEQDGISLWKPDLFLYHLDRLAEYSA